MRNLNIVITGIMLRLVLARRLSPVQWAAVVLLTIGTTTTQLKTGGGGEGGGALNYPLFGYGLVLLHTSVSCFAGVYNESIMKKGMQSSIHVQNMQLYAWGVLFNGGSILLKEPGLFFGGFFRGFGCVAPGVWRGVRLWMTDPSISVLTWVLLLNMAFGGLVTSAVIKHSDNIVKVFTNTFALMLGTAINTVFLGVHFSLILACGIGVLLTATFLYFGPGLEDNKRLAAEREVAAKKERDSYEPVLQGDTAVIDVVGEETEGLNRRVGN